jgi:hypothetical protein
MGNVSGAPISSTDFSLPVFRLPQSARHQPFPVARAQDSLKRVKSDLEGPDLVRAPGRQDSPADRSDPEWEVEKVRSACEANIYSNCE